MQSIFRATVRPRSTLSLFHGPVVASRATYPRFGVRTMTNKRYTKDHETVLYDDSTGIGVVTITEHAQAALGDVVYVELPAVGRKVEQGGEIGVVESVKAVSEIYAPVSGTIEEINENLKEQPSLLNKYPEEKGWLCKIRLSNPSEMEKLLTQDKYQEFTASS